MHSADITALLKKAGSSQQAIATELGIGRSAVCAVVAKRRTSQRVQARIAQVTGQSVAVLWPKATIAANTSKSASRNLGTAFPKAHKCV